MESTWKKLVLLPLLLSTACAFSDVGITLAEFEPSLPANHSPALAGQTFRIAAVTFDGDVEKGWQESEPADEPEGFEYHHMSDEAGDQLSATVSARHESGERGPDIGFVRNGFGMKTASVYALGDPATWFGEILRFELENQGAKVVDGPADVEVDARVRYLEVDLYMTTKAHLVVDFTITRDGNAEPLRLHTYGTKTAWVGSAGEYLAAIRSATQQLMWRFVRDPLVTGGPIQP